MSANPITDQILATICSAKIEEPEPAEAKELFNAYAEEMRLGLPEVAPDVIGEVLLHAALRYRDIAARAMNLSTKEINVVVNVLAEAGIRLHFETSST